MPATHVLLAMGARTAPVSGAAVALAGRTRVAAELRVARVTGSFAVALEASADGQTWDTLATLTATAVGVQKAAAVAVQPWHAWIRGRVALVDGTSGALVELRAAAPFVDPAADGVCFSKEFRAWTDGFDRTIRDAEDRVLAELTPAALPAIVPSASVYGYPLGSALGAAGVAGGDGVAFPSPFSAPLYTPNPDVAERLAGVPDAPTLDVRLELPGCGDAIRAAIVRQAEHLFRRHGLEAMTNDPQAAVTLRAFPDLVPGLYRDLDKFRSRTTSIWRGR